jgi:hypothetical protein
MVLHRWLEYHDLEELYEPLYNSGFTSMQSLITDYVTFTENDLEEMGVFKKGLRMQFLAILRQLRSFKLHVAVVRAEGLPGAPFWACGPSRKRISVRFHDGEKVSNASSAKEPAYNNKFAFGPWEAKDIKGKEMVVELDINGAKASSCVVGYDEIAVGGEEAEKPYPLVNNKTGAFGGVVVMKVFLKRSEEFDSFLKRSKEDEEWGR